MFGDDWAYIPLDPFDLDSIYFGVGLAGLLFPWNMKKIKTGTIIRGGRSLSRCGFCPNYSCGKYLDHLLAKVGNSWRIHTSNRRIERR